MAGLAIGSYIFGKISDRTTNLLLLYSLLEFTTGLAAVSTIFSFGLIKEIYKDQNSVFLFKYLLTSLAILPSTVAMGGTLPVIVKFFASLRSKISGEVGRLYGLNTLGAYFGVIISGFVLIELLGLKDSLVLAASINIFVGFIAYSASNWLPKTSNQKESTPVKNPVNWFIFVVSGTSGLVSLSYEVLWTRLLTPTLGTFVYAFSAILAFFLLGIVVGSLLFEKFFPKVKRAYFLIAFIEAGIGIAAVLSVIINSGFIETSSLDKLFLTILPGTILMGMSFPAVAKVFGNLSHLGSDIGGIYSANTVGSIAGSLIAAFIIIPRVGTVKGIIWLSLVNYLLAFFLIYREKKISFGLKFKTSGLFVFLIVFSAWLLIQKANVIQETKIKTTYKYLESKGNYEAVFLEDESASILGYKINGDNETGLLIDGIPTTRVLKETELLADIPLFLHSNSKNMLVIAFGMGTTYRSALLHKDILVDAVELVPSVPKLMYLFHNDAGKFLNDKRGRIFVNDGRNYVKMTKDKYDVIVVDPPPPVNAAGTTILYSKEFYQDSKKILNKEGIFVAWFYRATRVDDFKMLMRSFYEVFPNILVLNSPSDYYGFYLIGSEEKIDLKKTKDDFFSPEDFKKLYLGDEKLIEHFAQNFSPITDENPKTEFFLLRHSQTNWPVMEKDWFFR